MSHRGHGAATRGTAHDAIEHRRRHAAGSLRDRPLGSPEHRIGQWTACSMWRARIQKCRNWIPQRRRRVSPTTGQGRDHGRSRHQQPAGYDLESPRSAMAIQPFAIERCSDLAEPPCAQLAPVWELVASIPAPRCDHRQHEDPALA